MPKRLSEKQPRKQLLPQVKMTIRKKRRRKRRIRIRKPKKMTTKKLMKKKNREGKKKKRGRRQLKKKSVKEKVKTVHKMEIIRMKNRSRLNQQMQPRLLRMLMMPWLLISLKRRKRRKRKSLPRANLWWTTLLITNRVRMKMLKWIKINRRNLSQERNVSIFIMLKVMKSLPMTSCLLKSRKKWKALLVLAKERLCSSRLSQSAVGLPPNLCGSTSPSRPMLLTEITITFYLTSCLSSVAKVLLEMKIC